MRRKILLLIILLFAAILWGVLKGAVDIPLREIFSRENQPILFLRLMRIALSLVAGSGLAVSGIVLQAIMRNSLAEPYLLGTSSGAGLGAVIAIIMGISWAYLPAFAFVGAIFSLILVYNLARQNGRIPEQSLILSGVVVSIALSAVIVFIISISGNEVLHGITWWLWGNLQVYDLKALIMVSGIVLIGVGVIYLFSQDLNAISIGEEEAIHLGINIVKVKRILIILASLVTASLVSICGIIGFVGLMIPHMMRLVVGPNHKVLIPATCLAAATFMVISDTLARTLFPPLEIPIGVITAAVGAPIFIILLKRSQRVR